LCPPGGGIVPYFARENQAWRSGGRHRHSRARGELGVDGVAGGLWDVEPAMQQVDLRLGALVDLEVVLACSRSRSADLFWASRMTGAAYDAWVEKTRLSRMNG
jgi:hypothetical protein